LQNSAPNLPHNDLLKYRTIVLKQSRINVRFMNLLPGNKKSPDLHEAKPRLIDIRHEESLILPL
jgi:hypothetical protein